MIGSRTGLGLLSLLIFLGLTLLYITSVKSSPVKSFPVKRGYVLDREGNPLILTKESYRAYLLLNGKSFLGDDLSPTIRKYLKHGINLPNRGLILLGEDLSLEEIKILKEEKNVIIERGLERKAVYQELIPLLGRVYHKEGISGLEKVFDDYLRDGHSLKTTLDPTLLKRVFTFAKKTREVEEVLVVNNEGEILAFYSLHENPFFEKTFLISPELFPYEIKELVWDLGWLKVERENNYLRITPLHLVYGELRRKFGNTSKLTLIFKASSPETPQIRTAKEDLKKEYPLKEDILTLPSYGRNLHLISGKDKIILLVSNSSEGEKYLSEIKTYGLLP